MGRERHLPLGEVSESLIQPGLECLRDGAFTVSLCNLFRCLIRLILKNISLISNLAPTEERENHFLQLLVMSLLMQLRIWLAFRAAGHVKLLINEHPKSFSTDLQLLSTHSPLRLYLLVLIQVQNVALGLDELHEVYMSPPLKPFKDCIPFLWCVVSI